MSEPNKEGIMIRYSQAGDYYKPTSEQQCNGTVQNLQKSEKYANCKLISAEEVEMSYCTDRYSLGSCHKCTIKCSI